MSPVRPFAIACAVLVGLAGCFKPSLGDRPFRCGSGSECPPDYSCGGDGVCQRAAAQQPDAGKASPDAKPGTPDARPADAGTSCTPSVAFCQGDDLVACTSGGVPGTVMHCNAGCNDSTQPAACLNLQPLELPENTCAQPVGDDIALDGDLQVDTSNCPAASVVAQAAGPDLCVYHYGSFTVLASASVRWTGPRIPVIVATRSARLAGHLFVNGQGGGAGPGANDFQSGEGGTGDGDDGGGGGGHATDGAPGASVAGSGRTAPAGGAALPDPYPDLLAPGGNGGNGGGGGGGAIGIVVCGKLTVEATAIIDAGGGGGIPGQGGILGLGGGGGGAGGTVRIEAADIAWSGGVLVANGGGGGGGSGIASSQLSDGDDGHLSASPAAGGTGAPGAGAGGNGATGDGVQGTLAVGGHANSADATGAGGGGGAAGVIVIRVRPGQVTSPPPAVIISPAPRLEAIDRTR